MISASLDASLPPNSQPADSPGPPRASGAAEAAFPVPGTHPSSVSSPGPAQRCWTAYGTSPRDGAPASASSPATPWASRLASRLYTTTATHIVTALSASRGHPFGRASSGTAWWVQARPVPVASGAGQAVGSDGSGGAVRQMT
jgi:hypothetical protein